MSARRILFVSQQLPWPLDSGGNIRSHHLLAALAARFDTRLLSTSDGSATAQAGRQALEALGARVELVPDTKRRGRLGQASSVLGAALRGEPAVLRHNHNPHLARAVAVHLSSADQLHLNHLDACAHVDLEAAPPAVIDTHNLLFEYYARRAAFERGALRRWACRREARLLRSHERAVFLRAARVLVCSQAEQGSLGALDPAIRSEVVPNGVDVERLRPADPPAAGAPPELVFVGDLAYGPNADAVLWFAREALPLVRTEQPRARFLVVGRNSPAELLQLAQGHPEIEVTGAVDDVRPYLRRARVCVVPIRYGSGTRLKVLEAFALGVPVVSTAIGAEGIECADGEQLLLADTPQEQAQAVLRLLSDEALAARLAGAGRALAEARYSWHALGEQLAAVHAALSWTARTAGSGRRLR